MTGYVEIVSKLVILPVSLVQVNTTLSRFQYLLPRLAIIGKLCDQSLIYNHGTADMRCWCRYANAMFASLNNRIAIREGPSRNAAITIPHSKGRPPNDTSDDMYLQLDRPPSVMIFTPSRESTRGSRESEGGDDSESLGEFTPLALNFSSTLP
jgi:hypothetical protein